ncbi:MAG: hypothetical protein RMJ43_03905 [Chloroherpetonaceae bacterium]|nr:hypothetical protein [Chloroherpetonaceae bacterium]
MRRRSEGVARRVRGAPRVLVDGSSGGALAVGLRVAGFAAGRRWGGGGSWLQRAARAAAEGVGPAEAVARWGEVPLPAGGVVDRVVGEGGVVEGVVGEVVMADGGWHGWWDPGV